MALGACFKCTIYDTSVKREFAPVASFCVWGKYKFRELHQDILIGTASDRYAGWFGRIYSEGRYEKGITRRSHKVGDQTFNEETRPVKSVAEYFDHFPLLEIDYTFYHRLLESSGNPTQNFYVLKKYRQFMKDGDLVLIKVPQVVIARKLRRGPMFVGKLQQKEAIEFFGEGLL